MTTGDRIRQLRLANQFSQEELGRLVGVQKAAINKYEKNSIVNLKRETLLRLAQALDTSPVYLMGFESDAACDAALPTMVDNTPQSDVMTLSLTARRVGLAYDHSNPEVRRVVDRILDIKE
ncbi:MAG: helix-turn-helix transcriptional regulator [Oscillospiraceae bacterium]